MKTTVFFVVVLVMTAATLQAHAQGTPKTVFGMAWIQNYEPNPAGDKFVVATTEGAIIFDTNFTMIARLAGHYGIKGGYGIIDYDCSNLGARAKWSPDGRKIATTHKDNSMIIWDAITYRQIRRIPFYHKIPYKDIYWSPDGNMIAASSYTTNDTANVEIWDTRTFSLRKVIDGNFGSYDENGQDSPWHPTKPILALLRITDIHNSSAPKQVVVVDIMTGEERITDSLYSYPKCVSWSPNGDKLAVTRWSQCHIYNVQTLSIIHVVDDSIFRNVGIRERIRDIAWAPDNMSMLIVCSNGDVNDYTGVLYVNFTTKAVKLITEKTIRLFGYAEWSPDGTKFAVCREYSTVYVYDAQSMLLTGTTQGSLLYTPCYGGLPNRFFWTKNSNTIIVYNGIEGTFDKYNTLENRVVQSRRVAYYDSYGSDFFISSDRARIYQNTNRGVVVWNGVSPLEEPTVVIPPDSQSNANIWKVSPDDNYILLSGESKFRVWDIQAARFIATFDASYAASLCPDKGKPEIYIYTDSTLTTWNYKTSDMVHKFTFPETIYSVSAWNSSGTEIAVFCKDHTISVINTLSGVKELSVTTDSLQTSAVWNPDGTKLLVRSQTQDSCYISVLNIKTGALQNIFTRYLDKIPEYPALDLRYQINDIVWSPDGTKLLVAYDLKTWIIDAITGEILHEHNVGGQTVAWPTAGPLLFITENQKKELLSATLLYNIQTGIYTDTLIGHFKRPKRYQWISDKKELFTIGVNNTAYIWHLNATGAATGVAEDNRVQSENLTSVFGVYPNPVGNILHWNISDGTATILNVMGQKMMELPASAQAADVSGLAAGVYVLTVRTAGGIVSRTFVKE